MERLVEEVYTFKGKVEDCENDINLLGSVIDTLVCMVGNMVYENKSSQFASVEQCTNRAREILETIKLNINEYLE